jgi:hypothetical protein
MIEYQFKGKVSASIRKAGLAAKHPLKQSYTSAREYLCSGSWQQ